MLTRFYFAFILMVSAAFAQDFRGSLVGTVNDTSGARVPSAVIIIQASESSIERRDQHQRSRRIPLQRSRTRNLSRHRAGARLRRRQFHRDHQRQHRARYYSHLESGILSTAGNRFRYALFHYLAAHGHHQRRPWRRGDGARSGNYTAGRCAVSPISPTWFPERNRWNLPIPPRRASRRSPSAAVPA